LCYSLGSIISSCQPKEKDTDNEISCDITDERTTSVPTTGLEKDRVSYNWTPKEKIVKLWFRSDQNSTQKQHQLKRQEAGAGAVALLLVY
jgi:hypothetical protein